MSPRAITLLAQEAPTAWGPGELEAAIGNVVAGAVVAFSLYRFVRQVPWPRPFRLRFALMNVAVAVTTGLLCSGSRWRSKAFSSVVCWRRGPRAGG